MRVTYTANDMVRDFHLKAHHLILESINLLVPFSIATLRIRLISEESAELITAMMDKKIDSVADSIADLIYVAYGTGISYGIEVQDFWPDDKDLKPLGVPDDETICIMAVSLNLALSELTAMIIYATMEKCPCGKDHSFRERRGYSLKGEMNDYLIYLSRLAIEWGIPIKEVFEEVHRSNMTKNLGVPRSGEKYASGVDPKGPGYQPPRIDKILSRRMAPEPSSRAN
jgi:predicted HAD superfamily Cof-like phosphohydrolase